MDIKRPGTPFVPDFYLFILRAPLDTPAKIQKVASLWETPAVKQTKTLPDGEIVNLCRVDGDAYDEIHDWIDRRQDCYLETVHVLYEGKRQFAQRPVIVE
ncbi:hypothetical protein V8E54_000100 [Elaphomyces granulatus]|jgi:hypothetical protein